MNQDFKKNAIAWRKKIKLTQEKLAEECEISVPTVQRWETGKPPKGENFQTFLNVIANKLGVDSISDYEFNLGPVEYERRREAKESREASQPTQYAPLDATRISPVYSLHRIGKTIDIRTRPTGFSFLYQLEDNPRDWFDVYISKEDQPYPFDSVVAVNKTLEPQPGDRVLVWDREGGSRFIEWTDNEPEHDAVHGVAVTGK